MSLGRRLCFAPLWLLIWAAVGCGPEFGVPRIWPPLPASTQVGDAKKFDPFPDPGIAPTVVGGRPLDYIEPRPAPDVSKWPPEALYPGFAVSYPPPPAYIPPAGVVYSQQPMTAAPFRSANPPVVSYPPVVKYSAPVYNGPSATPTGPVAAPVAYGTKITAP